MIIDDEIKNEKLKSDINREVGKMSALSSGKINKYKYLTCEEILPCMNILLVKKDYHLIKN